MSVTFTTLDKVKPGTVVRLAHRHVTGILFDGRIVKLREATEGTREGREGANHHYVWKGFGQGMAVLHGSTLCAIADADDAEAQAFKRYPFDRT